MSYVQWPVSTGGRRHHKLGPIHARRSKDAPKTLCGRVIPDTKLTKHRGADSVTCSQCIKHLKALKQANYITSNWVQPGEREQ